MQTRVIKNSSEYKRAIEELENLIALDPAPNTHEANRLELLALLVEAYEYQNFPVELPTAAEAIKFRMEEQELKPRDLIPFIGGRSKVSEVLSGKRPLTVAMIRALHEGLDIPLNVLVQEPQLEDRCDQQTLGERFPLKEMISRGWIEATENELRNAWDRLLAHFFEPLGGIQSIDALCRRTLVERSGKGMDRYALWAWTARVLIVANSTELPDYRIGTVGREFHPTPYSPEPFR